MNTTYKEQINAIQRARELFHDPETVKINEALNDAASTIAAIKWNEESKQGQYHKLTTGKFDAKNQEIFEGDKVLHSWGWFSWKGKTRTRLRIHTITVKDAHLMANGQMHDDGGGKIFCLGRAYNFWKGEEVQKLSEQEVKEIGITDDEDFFFDDDNKAIEYTDQHFMGLSDEDWQKEITRRNKHELDFLLGSSAPSSD